MALLGGKPLLDWAIYAASQACDKVYVVTDAGGSQIAERARYHNVHAMVRPDHLATDEALVADLIAWFGRTLGIQALALVQPTSPFVIARDIRNCLAAVEHGSVSAQTITPIAHNDHADNQRAVDGSEVYFVTPGRAQNKAGKAQRYKFGNCVAMLAQAAEWQRTPFPGPSYGIHLDNPFRAIDIDGPDDLKLAEAILKAGLV